MTKPPILVEQKTTHDAVLPQEHKWHTNPNGTVVVVHKSVTIKGVEVTIEPGAQLGREIMLCGKTLISGDSEVGNYVKVTGSTICEGARIGDHSTILNSVIGKRSHIGQSNKVRNAQIGPDVITACGESITGKVEDKAVVDK